MLGQTSVSIGTTGTYAIRVGHWAHILWLNQAALIARWFEGRKTFPAKMWLLWRLMLGFPWRRGRLAAAFCHIHRRAKVHYSAHVELSIVEEGADIGAQAVVKNSWVGRGARIEEGAIVNGCVVGEGAFVAAASSILGCVLYPGALAAQHKMQLSVLGRNAAAFTGSYFYDVNFERNVRVVHRGEIVDSGTQTLSVCLGPSARVAGGIWIASGREVPAHALVVQPPDHIVHRIDAALASAHMTTVRAGALARVQR
jgi:tetrahydrodipicolinate N-succinyltransferase